MRPLARTASSARRVGQARGASKCSTTRSRGRIAPEDAARIADLAKICLVDPLAPAAVSERAVVGQGGQIRRSVAVEL